MKIIQVIPAISEEASGPSYSVLRLSELLLAQGQALTLAALDWSPIPSPPSFLKTFPLGFGPRRLGISPQMKYWLDRQVASNNVDILHNHGMWQMNSVYPGWAAKKGHTNLVVSPRGAFSKWAMQHGSVMKKLFWPILQNPAFEVASCFHATAFAEYQDIRRLGFHQPVAIIPNGIDIPSLAPKKANAHRTLLFLGRLHPVKGLDMLLPAWQAVQDLFPDWHLRIVGSDVGYYGKSGYLEELQQLVRKLGLKRIEFLGGLYGIEKTQAYHDADLYILPSYSENFGLTVAEALAAGTPAIVTTGAPWSGLVSKEAGWWIEAGIDSLITCLQNALGTTPERLEEMWERGRDWMQSEFSWTHIAMQMADTYQWLLDKSLPVPAWVRTD